MVTFWKLKKGKDLKPTHSAWRIELNSRRPFRDSDKDGVIDMFDCKPYNKRKKGEEHKYKGMSDKDIEKKIDKDRTKRAVNKDIKKYGKEKAKEFWREDIED